MNIDASGGDEQGLRDQQKNPARKHCAMNVNEQIGKRGAEHAGEKIRAGEADKNGDQDQDRYSREKIIIDLTVYRESLGIAPW